MNIEVTSFELDEQTEQLLAWDGFFYYFPMIENSWRMNSIIWHMWVSLEESKKIN